MPSHLDAIDIALRLACAILSGAVLGLNRETHGHTAGLRTTILVTVSAALVMILANLLLATPRPDGVAYTSFDVLRLPLGLLSGVGFLGAGAIIQRSGSVRGITTAATIWFATAIGLCLGAGHLGLGLAATALGLAVLWALRLAEEVMPLRIYARLVVAAATEALPEAEVRRRLDAAGVRVETWCLAYDGPDRYVLDAVVRRTSLRRQASYPPALVAELAGHEGVSRAEWKMEGAPA